MITSFSLNIWAIFDLPANASCFILWSWLSDNAIELPLNLGKKPNNSGSLKLPNWMVLQLWPKNNKAIKQFDQLTDFANLLTKIARLPIVSIGRTVRANTNQYDLAYWPVMWPISQIELFGQQCVKHKYKQLFRQKKSNGTEMNLQAKQQQLETHLTCKCSFGKGFYT